MKNRLMVAVLAMMFVATACGGDDDDDGENRDNSDNPVLEMPTTVAP